MTENDKDTLQGAEATAIAGQPGQLSIFDILYGIITKPAPTLRYIAEHKMVLAGILLYVAIGWISTIAGIPGTLNSIRDIPPEFSNVLNPRVIIIGSIVAAPFLSFLGLAILGGIWHLLARLFKGEGTYGNLLGVLGFASFPSLLATPFALLDFLIGRSGEFSPVDLLIAAVRGLISLAFGIWVIVLSIIAIRENYKFSTGRAAATYFIPLAVLILIGMVAIVLMIGIIAAGISSMSEAGAY